MTAADEQTARIAAKLGMARTGDKHGALEDAILAGRVFASLSSSQPQESGK